MTRITRRTVLRGATGAAGAGVVGAATGGSAAAQQGFDGWFDGVENYDGVVDETGRDEVTVTVGSQANGGNFGFAPAAVRVDPGTTVVWEWNGKGGSHNVVDDAGSFESELTAEEGYTFSQTFEETGVAKYFCVPHEALGMKGAVVVGDVDVGAPAASGSGDGGGGGGGGGDTGAGDAGGGGAGMDDSFLLVGGGLVGALLSPVLFGIFLLLSERGGQPEESGPPERV
jgi:halocyanin-like protein